MVKIIKIQALHNYKSLPYSIRLFIPHSSNRKVIPFKNLFKYLKNESQLGKDSLFAKSDNSVKKEIISINVMCTKH